VNFLRRILILLLPACAAATAGELTATLETANLRLRHDAPMPLDVRFQNPTQSLLEGRLEFTLLIGDRKVGVHRTAELLLQPGTQTIPVLLPPPPDAHPGDGIAARLRWLGADKPRDLGDQQIGIYGIGTELVLGIVRTERRLTDLDHARDLSLKLESLRPARDAASWFSVSTHPVSIAARSLPVHPIGLCAFDAVFLDGPAFAAANEKQLTALARWVEGGGSLGICADARLEDRHIAFLDRLSASASSAFRFALDPNGVLTRSDEMSAFTAVLAPGLGRAFVVPLAVSDPNAFDRNDWRAAVAWLWKLRESEQREVRRTGRWSKDFVRNNQGWRGPDDGVLAAVWSAAAGFDALTPGAPRQMPLGVVALVLGALLIIAGPADWLVLGWLRKRRWTWFMFPLACVGFAWGTAHLAGEYLGVEDRSGCVRIIDIGDDGRPLREVRYELLLPARDREWSFDVRDAVAVPVPRDFREPGGPFMPRSRLAISGPNVFAGSASAGPDSTADVITEWPAPGHFILRRTLRQWTPAMVRITAFPEAMPEPMPDWSAALEQFPKHPGLKSWSSGADVVGAFRFEFRNRAEGADEYFIDERLAARASAGSDDGREAPFVRRVAFGNGRNLGGLGEATSPVVAGTSDIVGAPGSSRTGRILCAWRTSKGADGSRELLIYRRKFPEK